MRSLLLNIIEVKGKQQKCSEFKEAKGDEYRVKGKGRTKTSWNQIVVDGCTTL